MQTLTSFIGNFWNSLKANFGGLPTPSKIDIFSSYKSIVFTSLLGGLVFWSSYQAKLTSILAVDLKKIPFNDIESLSKTDYL